MTRLSIGFIGTGRIAQALISGLSHDPQIVICGYDKIPDSLHSVSLHYGVNAEESIEGLARDTEIIIIAVKPYQVAEVLAELKPALHARHLLISVAAGISTGFIESNCPNGVRVVRVMPNTPAFVGEGMTALCKGSNATTDDILAAERIFNAIGKTAIIDESGMDAATAVSGSGPAYMFRIIDSLAEGGEACGLDRETAQLLAAQTMLGAAKMVLSGRKNPEELVREVTTPGGTTEAGLQAMEERDLRGVLFETVKAAAARSKELMK
ncbi:pyrroline-5-carboxylate reductase [Chlorobaculum thiosulfatiphilum]|uniref:Pyrroline-5-carboxylate reductase n=1 Tax=Chlorobaculum thiosulfatiphilum TaxID=115852 RepID=A0A5C4S676_CHLTI|nr:pyrroline-5-carboxylate reductase [Chlorobaculum thiosulfatiphilum]TNJ39020.1 pyrroline-5-carboxylate reductase [Chlorobaculum thiosulfatiphilum]